MSELLLNVENVTKTFPGVVALDNVSLKVNKGEIHGLIGENGAGKSTIIKILAGIYRPDSGKLSFDGEEYAGDTISGSIGRGISVIYQELCLEPYMTVYENIVLGLEEYRHGFYSAYESKKKAAKILEELGLELPLDTMLCKLDIAMQQMVEIAKALSRNAKLIILDEPTSSISTKEIDKLFSIMENLKKRGVSSLFVSHKLEEIERICDRITIYRDGKLISSGRTADYTRDQMVRDMVGREVSNYYTKTHTVGSDEVVLKVDHLKSVGLVRDVSFELRKGEVLGVTGMVGSGRTEIAQVLFGLHPGYDGKIIVKGKELKLKSPRQAIANGIVLVPENRKEQGIIQQMDVGYNITLGILKQLIHFIFCNRRTEESIISKYMSSLRIKATSENQCIGSLSGGNQQKAILARWIVAKPDVLILDEPTRGIDIGAKAEIYAIINDLASQGVSIIVISSELPEVINVSDRIMVVREKRIVATLEPDEFSQENILNYSVGGKTK